MLQTCSLEAGGASVQVLNPWALVAQLHPEDLQDREPAAVWAEWETTCLVGLLPVEKWFVPSRAESPRSREKAVSIGWLQ